MKVTLCVVVVCLFALESQREMTQSHFKYLQFCSVQKNTPKYFVCPRLSRETRAVLGLPPTLDDSTAGWWGRLCAVPPAARRSVCQSLRKRRPHTHTQECVYIYVPRARGKKSLFTAQNALHSFLAVTHQLLQKLGRLLKRPMEIWSIGMETFELFFKKNW